ncbi:MAG: TonB-dependent receptor [Acetobacter sp.]|uniref:TonB-dependent receptor n=1 Tax=Acetobacter sp. TaxID=440 RepID=UPI0039EB9771
MLRSFKNTFRLTPAVSSVMVLSSLGVTGIGFAQTRDTTAETVKSQKKTDAATTVANSKVQPHPASPARPERAAVASGGIEETLVTAQRRQENMQKVGIAMSAVSGAQLQNEHITSPSQIPQLMAGVQLAQPNGQGAYTFSVRGVTQNDFADHEESPTAIYLDGAYVSQMTGLAFQIFDLERVEVLRGPQGTLFGRNATGGLGQFISKAPTEKLDGYARFTYGSYNEKRSEGAIGGALLKSGKILGRLSFVTSDHDPIFRNSAGGPRLENDHSRAGRAQLLFKLPEDITLHLIGRIGDQHNLAGGWESRIAYPIASGPQAGYGRLGGATDVLGYPGTGYFNSRNEAKNFANIRTYEATAKLNVPLAARVNWTTLFDYQHIKKDYKEDSDTTPVDYFEYFNGNATRQFSVDSHVDGTWKKLHWIGGFYYLNIFGNYYLGATGSAYGGLNDRYSLGTNSYAGFGQLDYAITRRFKLIGGIRYTRDIKDFSFQETYPGYSYTFNRDTVGSLAHSNTGFWSGKAEATYQVQPNILAYASYNVGVKAGSFNAPLDAGLNPDSSKIPFKPEELEDYEVGIKSDLLHRHLRVNLSGFFYNYKNYQALSFINLTQLVSNAKAQYYGGEAEVKWVPDRHWSVTLNLSYSHGVVKSIDLNGEGARDYQPANAPRGSGNITVAHVSKVFGGALTEQIDSNFITRQYFALTNAPDTKQKAYALMNVRMNYTTPNKKWDFNVSVENITNQHYATTIYDLAGFLGIAQIYPGRPRWWSATVAYHF